LTLLEEKETLDYNIIKQKYIVNNRVNYEKLREVSDPETFDKVGRIIRDIYLPESNTDFKLKLQTTPRIREDEELITNSLSLCPECNALLNTVLFRKDGGVWLRKLCPDHGETEELYWGDYDFYMKSREQSRDGRGIENPHTEIINPCPYNCGLCPRHKSHTALLNLVITNRCDLACWYCFFYAEASGYVYEPSLNHIRYMLTVARSTKPIPALAVQITGGEPTLRQDLVEIAKMCKELGFKHVQINTNGITVAFNPDLTVKLRQLGVNTYYMSFDGVTPMTNPKNHWEIPYALENARKVGLGVVLVPTVIKNVNDHEVGAMVKFGLKHNEIIRGVNFQPVSLVGRMTKQERLKYRITIPDVIKRIEEQTDGMIKMEDWYTVPFTIPLSRFIEAVTGVRQFEMSNHFACGAATYVFQDRDTGKIVAIPQFIDVEGLFEYLTEKIEELENGKSRKMVLIKTLLNINKFIDWKKVPPRLAKRKRLFWILYKILIKHDYKSLGEFHLNSLFLGMMHFMDKYNYDIARIQRCDIHYSTPDGRIVPFCTFNVMPELYRDRLQKAYSIPIRDYLNMQNIKSMKEERYVRDIKKLESGEIYKKYYEGFFDPSSLTYEEKKRISIRFGIPVKD